MYQTVRKWLRSDHEIELDHLREIVTLTKAYTESLRDADDSALRAKTDEFRARISQGETLEQLLPEAFAVVQEASGRTLGMRHYDVQLMGGAALFYGHIAEMKTGEGKTLVSTLPTYLYALTGKGVHIVTANEYLARRDSQWVTPLFAYLGLTVGCTLSGMNPNDKQQSYDCDMTYGTGSEFGFDYLRDHQVLIKRQLVQRSRHYALIDEIDSILIDEARTPLILSGRPKNQSEHVLAANEFAAQLKEETDYEVDRALQTVHLTDNGIRLAEETFAIANLFDEVHTELFHRVQQALRAHALVKRDVHYVIRNNEIILVDEYTGRLMNGRRYSEGLHQAVEALEGVEVQREPRIEAMITLQHYFRGYKSIGGMTGTAHTDTEEFKQVYGMKVIRIPTNHPPQRVDLPDRGYRTQESKLQAIVEEIVERHRTGQPVLIGTLSVVKSEKLSAMLTTVGVPHQVLNAKHNEEEAAIIEQAGQRGMVTVATNMAGRGTDIRLGEGMEELGGLHVIGTERHDSIRIDRQLQGRAGRQGDPGSSQFYISAEDALFNKLDDEKLLAKLIKGSGASDMQLDTSVVSRTIEAAQRRVEGMHAEALRAVIEYDDVLSRQCDHMYRDRMYVLKRGSSFERIHEMLSAVIRRETEAVCMADLLPEEWDLASLAASIEGLLLEPGIVSRNDLEEKEPDAIIQLVMERAEASYHARTAMLGEPVMRTFEQVILIQTMDKQWINHLDAMAYLRQGIHLRSYAGEAPLQEYEREAHAMFLVMTDAIERAVIQQLMKTRIHV